MQFIADKNNIESLLEIEAIEEIEYLICFSVQNNPICNLYKEKELEQEVLGLSPALETFNTTQLAEPGSRFRNEADQIQKQVKQMEKEEAKRKGEPTEEEIEERDKEVKEVKQMEKLIKKMQKDIEDLDKKIDNT